MLTELYTRFVIAFVGWELSNSSDISDFVDAEHLKALPPYIYNELLNLGKLAADGIQKKGYVFDSVPKLLLCGFLHKVSDFYMSDSQSLYSFLHLIVQEYSAALHWSRTYQHCR